MVKRKRVNLKIPEELHFKAKLIAVIKDKSLNEFIEEAIEEAIEKNYSLLRKLTQSYLLDENVKVKAKVKEK